MKNMFPFARLAQRKDHRQGQLDSQRYAHDGLSGFVQGGGFLITAAAPLIAAGLIQSGGGFSTLWWFHIGTNLMSALLVCVVLQRNWPERSPV